jgi:hypothetical protein
MEQLDVPFWSFDLKQDYRHLIQDQEDLLVLPWTELRFNPCNPRKVCRRGGGRKYSPKSLVTPLLSFQVRRTM